jgi:hypothetical protein
VEFAFMILEYHRYSGKSIQRWLPFVRSVITFFDQHYRFRCQQRTGEELSPSGQYTFAPSTSLETYKQATNPLPVITGLDVLLKALIQCDDPCITSEDKSKAESMLEKLPKIPTRTSGDHEVFSPAESFASERVNMEDPQLYGVFPYPVVQPDNELWQVAQDTWDHDDLKYRFDVCWGQTEIWSAKLWRTEEAEKHIIDKMEDSGRRFPAFWGPGPDWVPDVDHGGAGMIGLQEMLMQSDGEIIYLCPAWPTSWDVEAKLHAPKNTVVHVKIRQGKIETLDVVPTSRKADVVVCSPFELVGVKR